VTHGGNEIFTKHFSREPTRKQSTWDICVHMKGCGQLSALIERVASRGNTSDLSSGGPGSESRLAEPPTILRLLVDFLCPSKQMQEQYFRLDHDIPFPIVPIL
jgi:hypothetical protein